MWTIKEIEDNPTAFMIIDNGEAIACVYNRDFAAELVYRYNSLHSKLLKSIKCIDQITTAFDEYDRC